MKENEKTVIEIIKNEHVPMSTNKNRKKSKVAAKDGGNLNINLEDMKEDEKTVIEIMKNNKNEHVKQKKLGDEVIEEDYIATHLEYIETPVTPEQELNLKDLMMQRRK